MLITGEFPVSIEVHDCAQLPVGCRRPIPLWQPEYALGAKNHRPVILGLQIEANELQRLLQLRKEEGKGLRVVPDMRAAAFTAPSVVVASLPCCKCAILETETSRTPDDGDGRAERIDDFSREGAVMEGNAEFLRKVFKSLSISCQVASGLPCVPKPGCIVIADDRLRVIRSGRIRCRAPGAGAVGEIPGDDEIEVSVFSRLDALSRANAPRPPGIG